MNAPIRPGHSHASGLSRDEAARLLSRYPRVTDAEAKLILGFLRHGRHLDVGMLIGDEKLKPHLDRFKEDHASHFRLGFGEGAIVAGAIAAFLIICALIWEAAKPAALTL